MPVLYLIVFHGKSGKPTAGWAEYWKLLIHVLKKNRNDKTLRTWDRIGRWASNQDNQGNAGSQMRSTFLWNRALQVEQMGFQHFQLDVSIPRIAIFRPLDSKWQLWKMCDAESSLCKAHPAPRGSACRNSNSVGEHQTSGSGRQEGF